MFVRKLNIHEPDCMLKEALPVFGGFHANLSEVLAGGTDGLGVRVFFLCLLPGFGCGDKQVSSYELFN